MSDESLRSSDVPGGSAAWPLGIFAGVLSLAVLVFWLAVNYAVERIVAKIDALAAELTRTRSAVTSATEKVAQVQDLARAVVLINENNERMVAALREKI